MRKCKFILSLEDVKQLEAVFLHYLTFVYICHEVDTHKEMIWETKLIPKISQTL